MMSNQKTLLLSVNEIKNNWKTSTVTPHSMHYLCSRICSFPPSIPDYYIKKYSKEGEIIFDPWSGKGTVPLEALRNGRIGIGNDKSPEAYVLTHAKVRPIKYDVFEKYVKSLEKKISIMKVPKNLTEQDKKASVFYSKKTFEQILKLKKVVKRDNSDRAIFTKAIILGLLHGRSFNSFSLTCSHSYAMSPAYVKKYAKKHHLRRPFKDVIQCILNKGKIILNDSPPIKRGMALRNDSTKIKLKSNFVDMILTSPPYFNIQTYAWANWLRLWFLDYDYRDIRATLAESGRVEVYRNFMKKSIQELYRVLKPGGRCFIVVGDVMLRHDKTKFINTAEFLLPLCYDIGFKLEKMVVDTIPRERKVNTYVAENHGIKIERIMYLIKN